MLKTRISKYLCIASIVLFLSGITGVTCIASATGWNEFSAELQIQDEQHIDTLGYTDMPNSEDGHPAQELPEFGRGIRNLVYLQRAYPDVNFARGWDQDVEDWIITVTIPANGRGPNVRTADFYWCGGSMLPKKELANADKYWPLLYSYPRVLADPAGMSTEEQQRIKEQTSRENRKGGPGTPMFFFDFLYQSTTRGELESHLQRITFLGHRATVHTRVVQVLARVNRRINAEAAKNDEVKKFLAGIKSNDSYFWRIIEGTNRKSFHSLGIAVDILPKSQGGKQIFWGWAKDRHPDDWMLIPLNRRWMPPDAVIQIFEDEGFIWGGKWTIYDNMHFEYHPELIEYNFRN